MSEGINCYVEAKPFFALFDEIALLKQTTCLEVKLKNGAEYELPFMNVAWDTVEMPDEYHDRILFKISDLMLTTLRNLIKPELQCIWIDERGEYRQTSLACISKEVKSKQSVPTLDVQELVVGGVVMLMRLGYAHVRGSDFNIAVMKPINEDAI